MRRSFVFTLCFWVSLTSLTAQSISNAVPAPVRNDFEGVISFLASDWMEGRETGTNGALMASYYIASMMQLNGLMPYGDAALKNDSGFSRKTGVTYLQNFKMIRCQVEKSSLALIRNSSEGESLLIFAPGADYKTDPVPFGREAEAMVVFAGYGIEAPGKGYDDYAGKDVRNRIVMVLDGYPGNADTTSAAWKKLGNSFGEDFASLKKKLKTAEKHGALAVIYVDPKVLNSAQNSAFTEDDDNNFRHYLPGDTGKLQIPCFMTGNDATLQLLDGSGIDLAGFEKNAALYLSIASAPMQGKKVRFSIAVKSEEIIIQNVLGIIRGSDTSRNIIVGAHYDHLGVRKGQVFNGADDNASGVAGVLALAKVWADHKEKPRCNIIFAAWTGEEKGKLGSSYFARNSRIVPNNVSLVVNLDMISRSAPEDKAGRQLSIGTMTANEDLRTIAKTINSKLEKPFVLELWDVTGYSGSDYGPFAARKVPIITFHAGFPDEYHTAFDDAARNDPAKMENILKIVNDCISEATENPPVR
ncbi:MAG: M20/M25/M40 family metallo-hydrolase [Bacteroidetes bacterium]|nr:M20/M25/M40 family metallo-hydrolase [Bacteroidota bacterium]